MTSERDGEDWLDMAPPAEDASHEYVQRWNAALAAHQTHAAPDGWEELADDVRYAGGNGTSEYWRGFNDGIDKFRDRLAAARGEPPEPGPAIDVERLATALSRCGIDPSWNAQDYGIVARRLLVALSEPADGPGETP